MHPTIHRPQAQDLPRCGNCSDTLTAHWVRTKPAGSHGYIGERLDADAGLPFLYARYMAPQLALLGNAVLRTVS